MAIKKQGRRGGRPMSRRTSKSASPKAGGLKMSTRRRSSSASARSNGNGGRASSGRVPEMGGMTVREAGRKGGLIGGRKGGLTVKAERGREFYQEIGRKGGQRVRDLIAAGRRAAERPVRRRNT
jgi:general stress protein YciG